MSPWLSLLGDSLLPSPAAVDGRGVLETGTAGLMWLAAARRLPALRRNPKDLVIRLWFLNVCLLATALSMRLPSVYLRIDELAGVPNVSSLIGQTLALGAGWSLRSFYLRFIEPDVATSRERLRSCLLASAIAVMAVLFFHVDESARPSGNALSDHPDLLGNWVFFLSCCAYILVEGIRLWWRLAGLTDRRWLSIGLRTMAFGGVLGLLWAAHRFGSLVVVALDLHHPLLESELLGNALFGSMVGVVVLGSTVPAWGPRLGLHLLITWHDRYRAHQRLYPLWRALYEVRPGIALKDPRSRLADRLTFRHLRFHLYRRVIEIRDGVLAVEPWLDPIPLAAARGRGSAARLPEEQLLAEAEAAALVAAIRAHDAGEPPRRESSSLVLGGASLGTEVAVLLRLADAWERPVTVCHQRQPLPAMDQDRGTG